MSSTPTPNPPQPHDQYKINIPNNVIIELTFIMRAEYNVRTPLPCERTSRTLEVAIENLEITTLMCMFKFDYLFHFVWFYYRYNFLL